MTLKSHRRSRLGLGQKLAITAGLTLIAVVGIVASVAIHLQSTALRQAFFDSAERTTGLVASTLGGALRFGKTDLLEVALADFRAGQEDAIAWIVVSDASGANVLRQELIETPSEASLAQGLAAFASAEGSALIGSMTVAPVRFGPENDVVGGLLIGWSDGRVRAEATTSAIEMALIGLVLGAGFSGIAFLLLSRLVSAPIAGIDRCLSHLADGDFTQPAPAQHRRDDVGAMARNLERLRSALADAASQRARLAETERAALVARETMLASLRSGVGAVVQAVTAGDFTRRVETRFDDETLQGLAEGVNAISEVISRFLDDGEAALHAMSSGDLTRAMGTRHQGRLDAFARALNATLAELNRIVTDLQATQASILGTVQDIGRDSAALSDRAISQAAAMQQSSATMVELSTTIRVNAENAEASAAAIGDARGQADVSRDMIERAIAAMGDIQSGAQEITEIVNAIDGFAFQTNLLALNAAVEAARAGDAGKGFAVVATEVRTLAQRAAEAAKDIRRLIQSSQASVDRGAEVVEATGTALSGILTSFVSIGPAMADISQATREQSLGVGELTFTLTQIDATTQETATLAETGALRARSLQEQAGNLSQLIGFFRPQEQRPAHARAAR